MSKWKEIWNKRMLSAQEINLDHLIQIDGFDNAGTGKIDVESWKETVDLLSKKLIIKPDESIFEVGCGGGAFLYPFYEKGHKVGGIDYSESLIKIANDVMKGMDFRVIDAINMDTREKYDYIISNSVFQYFPNLEYSRAVIYKMLDKAEKAIAILDLPNSELKEKSEKMRRDALLHGEYEKKYKGLGHLYYYKNWLSEIGSKRICSIDIFDQNIKNYGNSNFRFNVVFRKLSKYL